MFTISNIVNLHYMPPYGGGKGTKQYGWVTGCTSTYTNWGLNEPNNMGNREDYACFWYLGDIVPLWNDISAADIALCGCQYKPSTVAPSKGPTAAPSGPTAAPSTIAPSKGPTAVPSTVAPSKGPTVPPSTVAPSKGPTAAPSTVAPSTGPTVAPFELPSCPAGWTLQCGCQWSPPY